MKTKHNRMEPAIDTAAVRHQRRNVRSLIPRSSAASNLLNLPCSHRPKTSRNFNIRTPSRTSVRLIESLPGERTTMNRTDRVLHNPDRSCATYTVGGTACQPLGLVVKSQGLLPTLPVS